MFEQTCKRRNLFVSFSSITNRLTIRRGAAQTDVATGAQRSESSYKGSNPFIGQQDIVIFVNMNDLPLSAAAACRSMSM
jgi:hypothetical protein